MCRFLHYLQERTVPTDIYILRTNHPYLKWWYLIKEPLDVRSIFKRISLAMSPSKVVVVSTDDWCSWFLIESSVVQWQYQSPNEQCAFCSERANKEPKTKPRITIRTDCGRQSPLFIIVPYRSVPNQEYSYIQIELNTTLRNSIRTLRWWLMVSASQLWGNKTPKSRARAGFQRDEFVFHWAIRACWCAFMLLARARFNEARGRDGALKWLIDQLIRLSKSLKWTCFVICLVV